MQTNAIKRFATEARNILKAGIAAKIRTLGFDKHGRVADEHRPQLMQGGTHWNGQLLPAAFYHQWTSLYNRIRQKGLGEVYEEAAYTWFNRLCAIRILQKNDLCAPVLDFTDAARTPFIVDEARQGRIPPMNDETRSRLLDLLDDDTKVTEQFAVLINAWCHDNPIIYRCFGAMADYTELLLPANILAEGGFVDMANHTDFIADADYRSPELIGWLYQFYISERKDEVFAKKGKFEADEIPAATQIFTPNWIVKYMVQNTVGRIYLDNNPYETQLQKKWKYLVDTAAAAVAAAVAAAPRGSNDTNSCNVAAAPRGSNDANLCNVAAAPRGSNDANFCKVAAAPRGSNDANLCKVAAAPRGSNNANFCCEAQQPLPHNLKFVNTNDYISIHCNNLPHWNQNGCVQFVTFRLADSFPQEKLQEFERIKDEWMEAHPKPWDISTKEDYDNTIGCKIEKWLDAGYGSCILQNARVRQLLEETMQCENGVRYQLHAYVIMPNHVHALLSPMGDNKVEKIVGTWKTVSAHKINKLLEQSGAVWEKESFDHMPRNMEQFNAKLNYIASNPQGFPASSYTLVTEVAAAAAAAVAAAPRGSNISDTNCCEAQQPHGSNITDINSNSNLCCEAQQPLTNFCREARQPLQQPLQQLRYDELTDLRVADLACGSGHILNECFDLLYDLYIAEGYSRREAIESIFRHNLTGVDIDTRARQLATFALLLKACQRDASFADGHCLPRVMDMPQPVESLDHFFGVFMHDMGVHSNTLVEAVKLCGQAHDLGSIMKFDITDKDRHDLAFCINRWHEEHETHPLNNDANEVATAELILALTQRYHALVMNPPYMGSGNMNAVLSGYVKKNYEEGKADLATVFVQMMGERTVRNGRYAYIIPPSWMFLSTFEGLRKNIIEHQTNDSLLHLSRGVFGADFGASSAVIANTENTEARGTYFRLIERTFQEFEQDHLRMLFEQTLADHDFKYNFKEYNKDVTSLPYSEEGNRIYYPNISQQNFGKIPGSPIGYWVSEKMIEAFGFKLMGTYAAPKAGLATGDNNRFQRAWPEVSFYNIGLNINDSRDTLSLKTKWYPCLSGGRSRKWGEHIDYVVNWLNDGYELKHFVGNNGRLASRPQNTTFYFKEGLTWNKISSNEFCVRFKSVGSIFDDTSRCAFVDDVKNLPYLIGILCSKVSMAFLKFFNPTMSFTNGDISRIPLKFTNVHTEIDTLVRDNISISKQDWDAHETSWDFEENELVKIKKELDGTNTADYDLLSEEDREGVPQPRPCSLADCMERYKAKWEALFHRLHRNEEELNRQFIDIYGLGDELSPEVPMDEVTILQQGEVTFDL